jgi:hypothetical protein
MGWAEAAVAGLEHRVNTLLLDVANLQAVVAGLAQDQWQGQGGGADGFGLGGAVPAVLTSSVANVAANKDYTTGTANFLFDTGSSPLVDNGVVVPGGVRNYHDKTFASGATVWIAQNQNDGNWWVLDVWSCTALS